jgi:hypothetical protein
MDFIRYLLEGTLSGINLLRKGIRGMRSRGNRQMQIKPVALVLMEISADPSHAGQHDPALPPVEQMITELLKAVLDTAQLPLTLNKLEGDAALLYAVASNGDETAARSVAGQARAFFKTFNARKEALAASPGYSAGARQAIHALRFRVLLHFGQAAFKNIQHFEEIAGEDVILIHRLLKNSVPSREYALMTKRFYQLSGGLEKHPAEARVETAEGLGNVPVWVFHFTS